MSSIADVYTTQGQRGNGVVSPVTVTDLPTLLATANPSRGAILLQNVGSVDVYLGDVNVTTGTGLQLAAGQTYSDDRTTQAWYGVVASGTSDVRVLVVS